MYDACCHSTCPSQQVHRYVRNVLCTCAFLSVLRTCLPVCPMQLPTSLPIAAAFQFVICANSVCVTLAAACQLFFFCRWPLPSAAVGLPDCCCFSLCPVQLLSVSPLQLALEYICIAFEFALRSCLLVCPLPRASVLPFCAFAAAFQSAFAAVRNCSLQLPSHTPLQWPCHLPFRSALCCTPSVLQSAELGGSLLLPSALCSCRSACRKHLPFRPPSAAVYPLQLYICLLFAAAVPFALCSYLSIRSVWLLPSLECAMLLLLSTALLLPPQIGVALCHQSLLLPFYICLTHWIGCVLLLQAYCARQVAVICC